MNKLWEFGTGGYAKIPSGAVTDAGVSALAVADKVHRIGVTDSSLLYWIQSMSRVRSSDRASEWQLIISQIIAALELGDRAYNREQVTELLTRLCVDVDVHTTRGTRPSGEVINAIRKCRKDYEGNIRSEFVETSISRPVWAVLDYVLGTRKFGLIRGNPRLGKSESVKAWHSMHRGQAILVSLSAYNSPVVFFRAVLKAALVPHSPSLSIDRLLGLVDDVLHETGLMLIIDEANYMWPQRENPKTHPMLINWVLTNCFNAGVPVVMAATMDFDKWFTKYTTKTDWASEQLRKRIKMSVALPAAPTDQDMAAVARKRLPTLKADSISAVVRYAKSSQRFMEGISEIADDASWLANGSSVTGNVVARAIRELRMPSDGSLLKMGEANGDVKRTGNQQEALQEALQEDCTAHASSVQAEFNPGHRPNSQDMTQELQRNESATPVETY